MTELMGNDGLVYDTFYTQHEFYIAGEKVSEVVYRRHELATAVVDAADHFYTFQLDPKAEGKLGEVLDAWDQRHERGNSPQSEALPN